MARNKTDLSTGSKIGRRKETAKSKNIKSRVRQKNKNLREKLTKLHAKKRKKLSQSRKKTVRIRAPQDVPAKWLVEMPSKNLISEAYTYHGFVPVAGKPSAVVKFNTIWRWGSWCVTTNGKRPEIKAGDDIYSVDDEVELISLSDGDVDYDVKCASEKAKSWLEKFMSEYGESGLEDELGFCKDHGPCTLLGAPVISKLK